MNPESAPLRTPPASAGEKPIELLGLNADEWPEALRPVLGDQPAYRARSLRDWVFRRRAWSFDDMSDLPGELRRKLERQALLHPLVLEEERLSRDGTRKFLWRRHPGEAGDAVESVSIPDGKRHTFCISTQAGCPVKCTFCATGFGGFSGQLGPGEIVDQVIQLTERTGRSPTNLVFMGMGEPLLNPQNVFRAIGILTHPRQIGLGARRLTLSTVGIPHRIVELAHAHPQVKLAVSLHAPRDEIRDEIIPLNRKHPLRELLEAIEEHHRITGKKVTFEYIILPGTNDSPREARELARIARRIPSRINLIGFNPFPGSGYDRPEVQHVVRFRERVKRDYRGDVSIRRSRGEDIQGACGQLSLKHARGQAQE